MLNGAPNAAWPVLLWGVTSITFPIDFTGNPAEEIGLDNLCLNVEDCCCTGYDDQSLHGWGPCPPPDDNVTIWIDQPGFTGIGSDYYLHAKDESNSTAICAPQDCLGDWTVFFPGGNTALSYYVRIIEDGCSPPSWPCPPNGYSDIYYAVDIKSPSDRAIFRPNFPITDDGGPNSGWHHFLAPLNGPVNANGVPTNAYGTWQMDPALPAPWGPRWDALVQNVVALRFFLDWQTNQLEEIGLDSICIIDSLPVPVKPSLQCCTYFEDDFGNGQLDGWGPCPDAPNVTVWNAQGGPIGASDWYLRAKDEANASALCAAFCPGDWIGAFRDAAPPGKKGCGQLCYYFRIFNDGDPGPNPVPHAAAFTIYNDNAGISATFIGPTVKEGDPWTYVCAPIYGLDINSKLPPGWNMRNGAPDGMWELLISDVTRMTIGFDWTPYQTEEIGVDDFCLFSAPCPKPCPIFRIEKTEKTLQGHYANVSVTIENSDFEMGGFDFLIAYDASALIFTEAQPGDLLDTCDWEYFTYRFGADGNCGNACPSGLLRLIGLAETNNGPYHPSCYGPPDTDPHELARMTFMVSNNRVYNGQYIPIEFFWGDCGDNSISSVDGEILYIDRAIYDFEGNLIWDEEDDLQFSEDARIPFVGAADYCLNPDPDKPSAIRCPEFVNGGIDIISDTAIDARGDINCNGLANEIADAVMFTNYFIMGLPAFENHGEASIAASDVNADGMALSVADLVYLIRIITGDAPPYPKPLPYAVAASVNALVNHSAVGVSATSSTGIGAGYFVFEYSGLEVGEPHLINGASAMSLKYGDENGTLKVLVYSLEKGVSIPAGVENIFVIPIHGDGSIKLTDVQLADYQGNLLAVKNEVQPVLPKAFALHQNYPNPFNAGTVIAYELPVASDVKIEIINVLGQTVVTVFDGRESAGIHTVQWAGTDDHGALVASGIYIYRMTAGGFTTEKKMVLMK
jgi:hypothetical protein